MQTPKKLRSLSRGTGSEYQMMTTFRLQELSEPAVFVQDVAKQQDEFVYTIAFGNQKAFALVLDLMK